MIRTTPPLLFTSLFVATAAAAQQAPGVASPQQPLVSPAYAANAFVANRGQWHADVLHAADFGPMRVFLERAAFTVDVHHVDRTEGDPALGVPAEVTGVRGAAVRFSFGAPAAVTAGQPLPGKRSFLLGNDCSRWCGDVPASASVRYEEIAPGVALDAYCKDGHFEYDVLAVPGADLAQVTIDVAGGEELVVRADGSLAIATPYGPIVQSAPVAFVGEGRRVACRVELRGPRAFGFVVPGWNGREPLRIDPGVTWSSYIGGSGADGFSVVAVGADGLLTVAGGAASPDFPITPGAYQSTNVNSDCVVLRIDPSQAAASQIVSSTWFGGGGTDNFVQVVLDDQGVATLFGQTRSTDLPTSANAYNATFGGGTQDAMLVRLDLSQTGAQQLLYSTYLGGSANEFVQGPCRSLIVENGVATVTGSTLSTDFPTTANAWSQVHLGSSGMDAFLVRLDPSQPPASQLLYSSYVGGSSGDGGLALDFAPGGLVAMFGTTSSADFPVTANAYDNALGGPGDAMLMLWDLSQQPAQQIVYATYFGGSLGDTAPAMRIDRSGAFCFGGHTFSSDLPVTANAFDQTFDTQDAYCARLDPSLPPANQLTWCTFVGGTASESGTSLVVDSAGVITMSGGSTSTDFPVTDGSFQQANGGGFQDMWVVRLDPARAPAEQLLYSTYLGGDGLETMFSVALDAMGGVWAVGFTQSTDFPTTPNGYDGSPHGGNDGFLTHFDMLPTGVTAYGASSFGCEGALAASVTSMPRVGNQSFALTCNNLTPPALGLVVMSFSPAVLPTVLEGVSVWVDLSAAVTQFVPGNGFGADYPLAIPTNPAYVGLPIAAQFAWLSGAAGPTCPANGLSASNALLIVVQP
ncbi:MAG: hypothetical protein KDC48_00660 [Planctomycetes bacterium]|nr:hypothetical protein [Planctomycetota bacterium]